jgi:glycerol-3-phosphate acyltransferase PlsY
MSLQATYSIAILFAYLLGSISSAVIVARIMSLPDPRSLGSGNPGATNVLRTGNKKAAAITLLGDLLKGLIPVMLAKALHFEPLAFCAVGLAAIIGHMYPVFLGFKGGKGVATTLGVLMGVSWPLAVGWIIVWLSVAKITAYSSLAALSATILLPIAAWLMNYSQAVVWLSLAISLLVVWRHRGNVKKLLSGQETKISFFTRSR